MKDFKETVQEIIKDYCEGIDYLEFNVDDFPDMLSRIEEAAATQAKEQLAEKEAMVDRFMKNLDYSYEYKTSVERAAIEEQLKTIAGIYPLVSTN